MIGNQEKFKKYNPFKYYLRQCRVCDEIFKAYSTTRKRPKGKLCPQCKDKLNKERLALIIKTKQAVKKARNELKKLNI